jgi:hypothetical protein
MANKRKWRAVDSWAYVEGDATRENVNATARQMKETHKHVAGLQVRHYKRTVKAGGAVINVVAVVARAPWVAL